MCSPSEVTRRDLSPLSKPTGLTGSTTSGRSGCLITACISTRRGVRTARSSTNRPLSKAVMRRSCLSSNRICGTPFTCSSPPFGAVVLSLARGFEHRSVSVHDLYRFPPVTRFEPWKPGFLSGILASLIESLNRPVEPAQRSASHSDAQTLPLGMVLAYIGERHQAVIVRLVQFRGKRLVGMVFPPPPVRAFP